MKSENGGKIDGENEAKAHGSGKGLKGWPKGSGGGVWEALEGWQKRNEMRAS